MSSSHKEAKRLAKSVKRRRSFAEQLRVEAKAVRAAAQTKSGGAQIVDETFANQLDALADREFATAREEETAHLAASQRPPYVPPRIDPEQEARAARALGVLAERGSAARVRYMADEFGVAVGLAYGPSELLKMVEALLDREKMDVPENRSGMTFGQRINHAETLFYTKPRF